MNFFSRRYMLFLVLCLGEANALICPQPRASPRRELTICWSQESSGSSPEIKSNDYASSTPSWTDQLDSKMLEEVRQELVQKYLAQGITQEQAEQEVDVFLADKDRSEKYMEMRMYAAAQADDLGLGLGLQLLGGFLIGFIGIVGPKYFQAYQAANAGGDVPNPLL